MFNLAAAQTKTFFSWKLSFRFLGVKMLLEKNACCFSSEMFSCWKKILRQFKLNFNLQGCKKFGPLWRAELRITLQKMISNLCRKMSAIFLLGVAAPEKPNKIILCLKLFWCFGLEIHSELLFLWTKLFWWKFPVDVTKERPAYLGIGINWLAGLKWGQFYFESPVVDTREYPETFFGTSQRLEPDYFWKVSFFYFASKTQRRIVVFEFMEITKNA